MYLDVAGRRIAEIGRLFERSILPLFFSFLPPNKQSEYVEAKLDQYSLSIDEHY